jgi:hypothetical protein
MKWYDYLILFAILIISSISLYFSISKNSTITEYHKDTTVIIERFKDSIIYFQKEIIKNKYEYKIDSIIISHIPDSSLPKECMSRARYLMDTSRFIKIHLDSTIKGN